MTLTKKIPWPAVFLVPIFLAAFLTVSGKAQAALITYNSEGSFFADAPIASTETFDGFSSPTTFFSSQVTIDGVVYTATTGGNWSVPGAWGGISGTNGFGSNFGGPNEITFGTGNTVEAFGFYFIAGGTNPIRQWRIEVFETGGLLTNIDVIYGSLDRESYYGFLSDIGIEKLVVRDFPPEPGDFFATNWSYDNISRSAIPGISPVPTPSTLLLLGIGLVGLAGFGSRWLKQ